MNYERMMWYIMPDLSHNRCTSKEIGLFKAHYTFIKYELVEIETALSHIFGKDVADTILLYIPDVVDSLSIIM